MSSKASTSPVDTASTEGPTHTGPDLGARPARIPLAGEGAFQRGRIVWGRPPQATFRAGPLPRDEGLARLMAMPPHPQPAKPKVTGSAAVGTGRGQGGGMGGFSNVPRPAQPQSQPQADAVSETAPERARPLTASSAGIFGQSLVPSATPPSASKPQTPTVEAPQAVAPQPVVSEPAVPVAAATVPTDSHAVAELAPVTARRSGETVVVAPVAASRPTGKRGWGLWVAVGAVVIAAGAAALWWDNRAVDPVSATTVTGAQTGVTTPVAAAAVDVPLDDGAQPATLSATEPAPATVAAAREASATPPRSQSAPVARRETAPAPTARAPTPTPAPASTSPATPAPRADAPAPVVVVVPSSEAQTAPSVVQGPPPTTARPAETDPNAPVVTRPAKLD